MAERRHGEAPTAHALLASAAVFAPRPASEALAGHPGNALPALQAAAGETGGALDPTLRERLESGLGRDFSGVRVHSGPLSARAAERMGARAYTLGSDIHLGAAAQSLSQPARARLLTHEAVHTVQQGGARVAPHARLAVSSPHDAAEREAEHIAQALPASPSLALRDGLRRAPLGVARSVAPQLQRDLNDKLPVAGGDFKMNLKTESHPGAKCGMSGTIKFKANVKAPDSTSIRLLQVVRLEDLSTGTDYKWTGGEAGRNKVMTTADKKTGVEGGYFVDKLHAALKPRTSKADKAASPYYIDDYPGTGPNNQDGSKKGKAVTEASLWDYPGWSQKSRFSFETVATAADTGHVYGTVMWGFTISDGAKGTVEKEYATGRDVTTRTTDKAIEKFNAYYRNPGASTAP